MAASAPSVMDQGAFDLPMSVLGQQAQHDVDGNTLWLEHLIQQNRQNF
jgi:hypothetical protein